jgi:glycosyltransferase involved in cell wall biosynthesis
MPPFLSIIIPVFNGEKYLADAIKSVIKQNYKHKEIIVIDDGSVDQTANIAQEFQDVKYFFQSNQTVAVARNTGIRESLGEWVTFLDHDDQMTSDSIQSRIEYIQQYPQTNCLISQHISFMTPGIDRPDWIQQKRINTPQYGFGYLMARKSHLEKIGGYDPEYNIVENMEMFFRMKDIGVQIDFFPRVVIHRRIHEKNVSQQTNIARLNLLKMASKSIQRQQSETD